MGGGRPLERAPGCRWPEGDPHYRLSRIICGLRSWYPVLDTSASVGVTRRAIRASCIAPHIVTEYNALPVSGFEKVCSRKVRTREICGSWAPIETGVLVYRHRV